MGTVNLGEGQLVTLIVAIDNMALQMDIAIAMQELDPDDPRRPGDIIWHNADVDGARWKATDGGGSGRAR